MPSCFLVGCKRGYVKGEKVHLFCVPKKASQQIKEKWIKTVRPLRTDRIYDANNPTHCLCSEHFEDKYIISEFEYVIRGERVTQPRDRWELTLDAIPTKFPEAINHRVKRSPVKRKAPFERNVPAKKFNTGSYPPCPPQGQQGQIIMDQPQEKNFELEDLVSYWSSISNRYLTWEQKFIKLEGHQVCYFLEMEYQRERMSIVKKQIEVSHTMMATVHVGGRLAENSHLATASDLKALIEYCNSIQLCQGVPLNGGFQFSKDCQKTSISIICPPCKSLSVTAYHKQYKQETVNTSRSRNFQLLNYGYRRRLKRIEKQRRKTRLELLSLRSEIKELNTTQLETSLNELNLDHGTKLTIMESIKSAKTKSRHGLRYSTEWLLESTLLQIKSPAAYKHLRDCKLLPLPHPRTIKRLICGSPCEYGFSTFALDAIKTAMNGKQPRDQQGVLVFDEIKLRKSLNFNKGTLKFDGYVNYGDLDDELQTTAELADHALVFLYRPYNANWVQPVAVFATKGAASGDVLSRLLIECIFRLEDVGAQVVATVSDGATTNKRLWKNLGISGKKNAVVNKIAHPCDQNRHLHFCSDVPHLIKCIRNHFVEKVDGILQYKGFDINYKYYEEIFRLDDMNETGLKKCPKLTRAHIKPNNFEKMRVNYATQLLSNTVAGGMEFYRGPGKLEGSEKTQEFTAAINELFDVLNSRLPREGLTLESKGIKVLEDFYDTLEGDLENTFASKQTLESIRVTIRTTVDTTTYLINELKFKYVLTAKLNQDCLKKFFGLIRAAGGREDHPTVSNFIQLYRLLSIYTPMKRVVRGNITSDEGVNVLVNFGESLKKNAKETRYIRSEIRKAWEEELLKKISNFPFQVNSDKSSSFTNNSLVYDITGFVVKKARKLIHCGSCNTSLRLKSNQQCPKESLATTIKDNGKGKLTFPSTEFYELIVGNVEPVVEASLKGGELFGDVLMKVIKNLGVLSPRSIGCSEEGHSEEILCKLIPYYIMLRFHFFTRSVNKSMYKLSKCSRKMAKLQNS